MDKEQQIDAIEAQVREQHPSWNNADIRNVAVRMFYIKNQNIMDTQTVLNIIKMIDNQIDSYKIKMESKGIDIQMPAQTELIKLRDHLQSFIDGQLNAAELQSGE